jgi:ubiquinone/menaquinone biosynthesis C-methylase UbiE
VEDRAAEATNVAGETAAKERAKAQFGARAEHYVASRSHARADDLARMIELSEPRSTDRLLDVATGGGNVARVFSPLVASVVASDISPEMLAAVETSFRETGLVNVTFAEADAEDLPFAEASFELVACRIAPHHFPRPDRFVAEVERVLTPGGRFALVDSTVPAGEVGDFWNRFERARDGSHVRSLTIDEWSNLIVAAGLEVRAVEPIPRRHEFDDWVDRAGVSTERRAALASELLAAPAAVQAAFQVERDGDRVVAFTDVKTLFIAVAR